MKRLIYMSFAVAVVFTSCEGKKSPAEELAKLKADKAKIEARISELEKGKKETGKITPVSVAAVKPELFNGLIEVQSEIKGEQNILVTAQAPGKITAVNVRVGQRVSKGQVLAQLDASPIEQQIEGVQTNLNLLKSLYEKQKLLWDQNIGSEVQLLSAKTNYESAQKSLAALRAQREMYRVVSSINGTVDNVGMKVGEMSAPGMSGIHIVNYDQLKAEAQLGENYLGKVKEGDKVLIELPTIHDSVKTSLTYVAQSINTLSRTFGVEVKLNSSSKLHPNMSCVMKIANYTNEKALVVPVGVIQKINDASIVYVADGDAAKAVKVTTGRISNGRVEVLTGLKEGDKVIVAGYEEIENGTKISVQ